MTLNTTSRPSTNESAAAISQTAAGAAKGSGGARAAAATTSAIAGTVNHRVVVGAVGAVPERDLERDHERREHDQRVESVPADERAEVCSRGERTPAPRAPPPTQVGAGIVAWSEREHGLPTRSCAGPAS